MNIHRRRFHELAGAALGGVLAGGLIGCGGSEKSAEQAGKTPEPAGAGDEAVTLVAITAGEKHACRGLNTCRGLGKGGENQCAGQSECATYEHHECGGQNACKGQGGCGAHPAQNECKGHGGCAIPLMAHAWTAARAQFEKEMGEAGKTFADAPEATGQHP